MSFPLFLIGPVLQIIAGVVRYAIDASKDASEDAPPSSHRPTMEFSPLLAELVGSQAYAGTLLPQGWLVPAGDPGAATSSASNPLSSIAPPVLPEVGVQPFPLQEVVVTDIRPLTKSMPAEAAGNAPPLAPVLTAEPAPVELNSSISNRAPEFVEQLKAGTAPNIPEAIHPDAIRAGLEKMTDQEKLQSSPLLGPGARLLPGATDQGQAAQAARLLTPTLPFSGIPVPPDQPAIEGVPAIGGNGHTNSFAATRGHDGSLSLDGMPKRFVPESHDQPFQSPEALLVGAAPDHLSKTHENPRVNEVATVAPRELPSVTDQVVHAVRINWENGRTEARLHLEPPDLGVVRIQMVMDHTALSLRFHAGSDAARSLLEASLHELRDQLAQQGISVGQMSVGVALDLAGRSGGQMPAPFRVRDERWRQPASARVPESHTVPAPAISLSAIDLFA